jgi:hypothetical protein
LPEIRRTQRRMRLLDALGHAGANGFVRLQLGVTLVCLSEWVAKVASPTAMPTCRPLANTGVRYYSHEMVTNHLPVGERRMVAILGVPSRERWRMILTSLIWTAADACCWR